MKQFLGKYYEVILSIALFIVLDAAVLVVNYITSFEIGKDAHAIQLSSRQTMLSQNILHSLYQVEDDVQGLGEYEPSIQALTSSFTQFDEVLDSFIYGGDLIGIGQGNDSLLSDGLYEEIAPEILVNTETLWKEYRTFISPVIYSIYQENITREQIYEKTHKAIAFGREHNAQLLELTKKYADAIEASAIQKGERLRLVQTIGISLAILNFFLILFHFLKKLTRLDKVSEKAKQETHEILATVNDGLMLLDKDLIIGEQHSASVEKMFQHDGSEHTSQFSGQNFLSLIKPLVSDQTFATTEEYLQLLFKKHVDIELMKDLNPLDKVELYIKNSQGQFDNHYFSFSFSPVIEKGRLLHVLVKVNDITETVVLEAALASSKKQSSHEIELLMSVLHIEPVLLAKFIDGSEFSCAEINRILQKNNNDTDALATKLTLIARIAHKMKGDASAIGITAFEEKIHQFEEQLEALKQLPRLTGNDFLSITVSLNHLQSFLLSINTLVARFERLGAELEHEHAQHLDDEQQGIAKMTDALKNHTETQWPQLVSHVAMNVAKDYNKQVHVNLSHLDTQLIPANLCTKIKEVMIQFVRNAVAHGIEHKDQRLTKGKPEVGEITIKTETFDNDVLLTIKDDGNGLNTHSISARLEDLKIFSAAELNGMSDKQKISQIFEPGFTTKSQADRHSGRGVGLDIVKAELDSIGAKLTIRSKLNHYTEFSIRLSPQVLQKFA